MHISNSLYNNVIVCYHGNNIFIFENIVLLFLPSFKPYTVDGLCLAGLMSYASALIWQIIFFQSAK